MPLQGATSWLMMFLMQQKGAADAATAAYTVSGLELGGLVGGTLAGVLLGEGVVPGGGVVCLPLAHAQLPGSFQTASGQIPGTFQASTGVPRCWHGAPAAHLHTRTPAHAHAHTHTHAPRHHARRHHLRLSHHVCDRVGRTHTHTHTHTHTPWVNQPIGVR
jgi:hypothetical protein